MNNIKGHIDWFILLPIVALMLFSISFVYSASAPIAQYRFGDPEFFFVSHTFRVMFGLLVMLIFAKINYHVWQRISKPMIVFGIILLVVVLITGTSVKGASRWLNLGPLSFQPSEFAKFALVIHFAALLSIKQKVIKELERGFLPFVLWAGLICLLIGLQPNFSTMFVIFIIAIAMMFIGNINLLHLGGVFITALVSIGFYLVSAEYRLKRLTAFFGSGESGVNDAVNYQGNQSLIALGNGGLFGVGAGQSRQSHLFLPESYGDFIFAIIGEEYGLIGLLGIIAIFAIVFWRGMLIAKKAPDNFGYFLAVGILITFATYLLVNAGVNSGLLPTTGVPMPFVSYGGSAVLIYSAAIGILLNISSHAGVYPKQEIRDEDKPIEPDVDSDDVKQTSLF
jgi:cell division protein FtsW